MILRLVLVLMTIAAAWAVVALWERRRGRRTSGLGPGLTLVTADGCQLCGPALHALTRFGGSPTVIDADQLPAGAGPVHSVPTAIVTGSDGRVLIRRSGRSVITDAPMLAMAAHDPEGPPTSRRRSRRSGTPAA